MDPRPFRTTAPEGLDQVLSLDQIRAIRTNNDYVERPVPGFAAGPQTGFFFVLEDRIYPVHGAAPSVPRSLSLQQHLSRSSTVSSSLSRTSAASDQRLLACFPSSGSGVVRSQPKAELHKDTPFGKAAPDDAHMFICERCGRCKCQECCRPRRLPSCWAGERCLCSPQSLVESGTCLCCVKAVFYHCSAEDEEEDCADRPCSCSGPRCCWRWGAMTVLTLCLPCLCCYPPARLCLALCRRAHDRATRPGCRCSNTNTVCRKSSASNAVCRKSSASNAAPTRSKTVDKLL